MTEFQILSDSSCDLPESLINKHEIKLIPFYVSFDYDNYYKENVDLTNQAFYEMLVHEKTYPTTSLPTVQDYISEFRAAIKNGLDVLCLCLSHKLSGSYQSAINAKNILEEQYPKSGIYIIDSMQATAGQGILLLQIAYMKEAGLSLNEIIEKTEVLKTTSRIMFSLDSLDYLQKGRRIGKAVALAGDLLEVKPLIQLEGAELVPYTKIRGRKKSLDAIFEMTVEYFKETGENKENYDFGIVNATTSEDALYLQHRVEEFLGHKIMYPIFQIGVTIGTYTGPGGIGICFIKKYNCL